MGPDFVVGSDPARLFLHDLNGDAKPDLVVSNNNPSTSSNPVHFLTGDGAGHFSAPVRLTTLSSPASAAFADFDGNGHFDIALLRSFGSNVGLYLNTCPVAQSASTVQFGAAGCAAVEDAGAGAPNPIEEARFFVLQHYHDFLNREPDQSGWDFWTDNITSCGNDAACREVKRINVSAAVFLSIEFQETGYLVYRMYKTAYGDSTSPNVSGTVPVIRLNEFLPDTQEIGQGVRVGIGEWEAQLEAHKQAFALEFVQRPRFVGLHPLSLTPAQFVDRLNQDAGGVLTEAERDQLVAQLSSAPDQTAGRAAALRQVAEHAQLRQREFNRRGPP